MRSSAVTASATFGAAPTPRCSNGPSRPPKATESPAVGEAPAGSTASAAPMSSPAEPPASVQYTHSGFRYVLGYGAESFGIWDRQSPGGPVETFPRTDDGWRSAGSGSWASSPTTCRSDQRVSNLTRHRRVHESTPAASLPRPTPPTTRFSSTRIRARRYLLGYGRTFFGIWQRSDPSRPLERFPRDDAGWAAAWRRFTTIESNYAEVGLGSSGS